MKLTAAQHKFMQECWDNRPDHGTGYGGKVWDRWQAKTANSLARKGLIVQPPMYTFYLGAHLTEAGRRSLITKEKHDGR